MERQFIFNDYHTWYDWRLILTAKDVTPPVPKTNYVDIAGMSGTLDLSESLTGGVTYKDRTVSASFWTDEGSYKDRQKRLSEIVTALHGRKIQIIEPDDPDHYFYGRVTVKSFTNTLPYAEIAIECVCEPWRYALKETVRYADVSGTPLDMIIRNQGVKTVTPTVTVTGTVTLTYEGTSVTLSDGSYRVSNFKLYQGVNVIGVSGSGTVVISYREAEL